MKRALQNLRSKSPEVRLMVAIVLALLLTALIAVGWGATFFRKNGGDKSKAPSPISALGGSIKGVIQNSKTDQKDVEIIDNTAQ
jgi:hypothetical protein